MSVSFDFQQRQRATSSKYRRYERMRAVNKALNSILGKNLALQPDGPYETMPASFWLYMQKAARLESRSFKAWFDECYR